MLRGQVTTSGQTFPTSPGDYTVTPTTGTPDVGGLDFGMSTATVVDAGIYSLWPNGGVIPGNDFGGGMDFKIWDGSTTTCTLRLDFDPWVTFISASITPDVIGANYVEWVFVNPSNYFGMCMFYTFNLSSSAPPGTALNWFASLSCDAPDACPQNDTRSATTYVANPNKSWKVNLNKMAVFHTGDTITGEITTADSTFSYEIGYMNLGTELDPAPWYRMHLRLRNRARKRWRACYKSRCHPWLHRRWSDSCHEEHGARQCAPL
ncbi:MAG: hypothetical protein JKY18_02355, partial [Flavobacteriales bacterium]|nr:hypothetical protein [Flavobacteriales bacterium]